MCKQVIIVHDVDGRIYFDAVKKLFDDERISSLTYRETSIFRKTVVSILKKREPKLWFKRIIPNLIFRLSVPFIKNKTIILGMAPYNIRFLWYGLLAKRNHVIYHTSWPYWWTENVPCIYPFGNNFVRMIYKFYLSKFNFSVVGVTPPTVESFSKDISNKEVHHIPHAVNLDIFTTKGKTENPCSVRKENKNVLFIGRVVKEKGIYDFAELVSIAENNYNFTIVGDGPELNNIKKMLSTKNNVQFLGFISDKNKIADILSNNDFLIVPSRKTNGWEELFGLVIIEAMAAGLVVIATDHVGPRGIIQNNIDGILLPECDNLSDCLYKVIDNIDYEQYNKISQNALLSVKKYSIEHVMSKWDMVISNGE